MNKRGILIVLSGPSGVGKGTIRRLVMADLSLNLVYSISMTTRKPRNLEIDGKDYFFVTKEEFKEKIKENGFLEYTQFVGNYYGTPKDYVLELLNRGKNVFLEIEINGAKQVMDHYKDDHMVTIFLVPPSLEELENRIRNRKTETEEVIRERLEKAQSEMKLANMYDFTVVNDDIQKAANAIQEIIRDKIDSLED